MPSAIASATCQSMRPRTRNTTAATPSTIARVRFGAVRFLLVGDAEAGEEQWLLDHAPDLAAEVLKVGHHGSRTSSTPAFLDAVGARLALISVGSGNRYGHPDAGVVASLAERGAFVLRTDQLGSVVVRTDGRRLDVEAAGERWALPGRSSDDSLQPRTRSAPR